MLVTIPTLVEVVRLKLSYYIGRFSLKIFMVP